MHQENPSNDPSSNKRWNAYKVAAVVTGTTAFLGASAILLPTVAGASWPFASANAAEGPSPVLHDSTLALLQAAVNPDPNPTKGGTDIASSEGSALVSALGPDGTLPAPSSDLTVDTQTNTSNGGSISVYVVKQGDNLSQIASAHGITMNTILWANNIKDPSSIKPGTSLVILPVSGIQHKVQSGETLGSIASKYKADAADIASFNGLADGAALLVGTELIIPGGQLAKAGSSSSSSKPSSKSGIKQGGSLTSIQANPYRGGSGTEIAGYYSNPLPGAIVTQSIHGWNAIDLGAPRGTPVYAAASGTIIVSRVGGWNGGYGNYVVISHANGTQTLYSHFSSINVSVGDEVVAGQKLGGVGMTGDATGNHLHFEVRGARNPFADCSVGSSCTPS